MPSQVEEQSRTSAPSAIPWDMALQLCTGIRAENRHKWYTAGGMMCRGCVKFSGGNPEKMCFANQAGNRGCYQVNARYDRHVSSSGE